jgi:two-component sensor histidine kinase
VVLDGAKPQALTLALHELGTNAAKYGTLSNERGRVRINWIVFDRRLFLGWYETGGPRVTPPTHRGFGSLLTEQCFAAVDGRAETQYAPEGIIWTLEMSI